jgi:threonine synthase
MDIQVSSNLERLLYELHERSGAAVEGMMQRFRSDGHVSLEKRQQQHLRRHWVGTRVDDDETIATIRQVYDRHGMIIDPHSAVAVAAADRCGAPDGDPMVILATAHPAKFPDAVERAVGVRPPLPEALADLFDREERFVTLPNDAEVVKAYVRRAAHR